MALHPHLQSLVRRVARGLPRWRRRWFAATVMVWWLAMHAVFGSAAVGFDHAEQGGGPASPWAVAMTAAFILVSRLPVLARIWQHRPT